MGEIYREASCAKFRNCGTSTNANFSPYAMAIFFMLASTRACDYSSLEAVLELKSHEYRTIRDSRNHILRSTNDDTAANVFW